MERREEGRDDREMRGSAGLGYLSRGARVPSYATVDMIALHVSDASTDSAEGAIRAHAHLSTSAHPRSSTPAHVAIYTETVR